MIHLEGRHKKIIEKILAISPVDFYAFGSRVTGTHRKFSDLDLAYKEPLAEKTVIQLETAFEESDLPFKVDLVNYSKCSEAFKKIIDAEAVLFYHRS